MDCIGSWTTALPEMTLSTREFFSGWVKNTYSYYHEYTKRLQEVDSYSPWVIPEDIDNYM